MQLKLGPGGLRDIEFTVQLLQLVHGATDAAIRQPARCPRCRPRRARLRRTRGGGGVRPRLPDPPRAGAPPPARTPPPHAPHAARRRGTPARSLALGPGARRRGPHLALADHAPARAEPARAPVLPAAPVGRRALPASGSSSRASRPRPGSRRSASATPRALSHIGALTAGVSRRATIQRHPHARAHLVVRRRRRPRLRAALVPPPERHARHDALVPAAAARLVGCRALRLTRVLSGSRFAGELLERIPEAVAWLEDLDELRPPRSPRSTTRSGRCSSARRRGRGREGLPSDPSPRGARLALSAILDVCTVEELGHGLSDVTQSHIAALVTAIRGRRARHRVRGHRHGPVRRARGSASARTPTSSTSSVRWTPSRARRRPRAAHRVGLVRLSEDARLPFELDADLRPGTQRRRRDRSTPTARTTHAGRSPGRRRRCCAPAASRATTPSSTTSSSSPTPCTIPAGDLERDIREVKRIKARVENERLPQGADPTRHLVDRGPSPASVVRAAVLAPGAVPSRTPSTLDALAAVEHSLTTADDARTLRAAWVFASRARSALTLWLDRTTDVLPVERSQLEGVARIMGYPPGSATRLEHEYLQVTRAAAVRARLLRRGSAPGAHGLGRRAEIEGSAGLADATADRRRRALVAPRCRAAGEIRLVALRAVVRVRRLPPRRVVLQVARLAAVPRRPHGEDHDHGDDGEPDEHDRQPTCPCGTRYSPACERENYSGSPVTPDRSGGADGCRGRDEAPPTAPHDEAPPRRGPSRRTGASCSGLRGPSPGRGTEPPIRV